MNAMRAEALNVLLCLVLGVALGGLIALTGGTGHEHGKVRESFAAEPLLTLSDDAGVQAMQSIVDVRQRRFALLSNLTRLAATDLDLALSLLPTDASHDAVLRDWISQRLAAFRPDLAARAAMAMRNHLARAPLIAAHVMAWRERDAAAAASWLARVLDPHLAEELVKLSMTTEPGFVARALFEWRGDPSREKLLSSLLERWAMLDASDAFRFLQSIPPSELTARMMQGVGTSMIPLPRAKLREWLLKLRPETRAVLLEEMVSMLAATTTLKDGSEWVRQFSSLFEGSDARVQWFATLASAAPEEAQRLLDTEPSDDLAVGCIRALGQRDRERAIDWTSDISDPDRRAEEVRHQWMAWLREDRWKALEWMNQDAAKEVFESSERQSLLARYPP